MGAGPLGKGHRFWLLGAVTLSNFDQACV